MCRLILQVGYRRKQFEQVQCNVDSENKEVELNKPMKHASIWFCKAVFQKKITVFVFCGLVFLGCVFVRWLLFKNLNGLISPLNTLVFSEHV